jgi:Holliday junction resolvase
MTEEGIIQKDIIKFCESLGGKVFRMNSGQVKYNVKLSPKGTPDLLAILPNRSLWIEVKKKDGKVSGVQKDMHKELTELGQCVIVARCIDDIMEVLK